MFPEIVLSDLVSSTTAGVTVLAPEFWPVIFLAFLAATFVGAIVYIRRKVNSVPRGIFGTGRRGRRRGRR